jgi:hypothetical protein
MSASRRLVVWSAFVLAAAPARAGENKPPDPAAVEFFEKKVRPVLAERCFACHSTAAKKKRGGLTLDARAAVLKGGDSGPAVQPGHPEKSLLIKAIRYGDPDLRMPPKSRLPEAEVAALTAWVKLGAPWPDDGRKKSAGGGYAFDLQQRKQAHWAWQPLRPPPVPPAVTDTRWPLGPVDRFLLAALEAKGLKPAPSTDPRTLLRRVTFDLIGLPPTPAEVEAFVAEYAAKPQAALGKLVDRLLASPHYGERWGRHWLDLVRYAETRGHEFDYPIPNAYQYRDYVVRAFNADVPYDQFVTEHLAGDLLAHPRLHPRDGFNESVLGTGFWFLGEELHSPVDIRQDKADRFDNRIDVLTKTFLGLTVACARCHDHKFDAISQRDYYSLFGFLESSAYRQVRFDALEHNRRIPRALDALRAKARPAVQRALAEAVRPGAQRLAEYLLAARDVRGGAGPDSTARARKLDPDVLARWVRCLSAAARDERDPLHAWAKAAADPSASEPARLAQRLRPTVEDWHKQAARAAEALRGVEVIVDYARGRPADWLPDDMAYGSGPVRAGDCVLNGTLGVRFVERGAAEIDPVWRGLKVAPGVETEPGALGKRVRAGRTLCTPTFTLKGGKVFALVRGTGMVYAAVDAHALINGPLHAQLVLDVAAGPEFRWVAHDLTPYAGHRTHLEFTAAEGADFAVALVVQADRPPGQFDAPNQALLTLLSGKDARTQDGLAAGYQQLFLDLTKRLSEDRIRGSAGDARLANWLARHTELFGASAGKRLADAVAPFLAAQRELAAQIKRESRLAPAMLDSTGVDERVYIRGVAKAPGEPAPRRFLEALAGPGPLPVARGSGRLELARQMTDPATNPLLARVMVNRIWHHLFGRGLVGSVDNLGELGERPTHPELLDYLADRFIKEGWSVKKTIRLLVLTRAYQMSSRADEHADRADPGNLLLHRMRVRRLEGEAVRDALLAVSGRLNTKLYGPSVPVYLTPFLEGRGRPASGPLDGDGRRSLYLAVRRNFLSPMLLAFDTPTPFSTVGKRTVSNVPAQALILMNDPMVHQQAHVWAKRVLARPGTARARITAMYQSAFSRPPTAAELDACLEFLREQAGLHAGRQDDPAVWADLGHALFNVKEFIFVH